MYKIIVAAVLSASPTVAQDLESMQRANQLGTIIGSETFCDIALDAAGIEAWIAANVAADDLSFAGHLQTMTMGQSFMQDQMTASGKVAHCASVKLTGKSMGLIK